MVCAVGQEVRVEGGEKAEEVLGMCSAQLGVHVLLAMWSLTLSLPSCTFIPFYRI